ncbi:hypothetical protein ACIRS3_23450 [Streptomyces virginiae]|uniref:hypothetical protein n=1 Tax=Streptomyces virginiae TaxID=1961 RepID=UPI00380ED1C7
MTKYLHLPAVRDRLIPLLERGLLATCANVAHRRASLADLLIAATAERHGAGSGTA